MRRIPGPVSRLSQDRDHTNTDNISNLSLPTTAEVICSPVESHHVINDFPKLTSLPDMIILVSSGLCVEVVVLSLIR